MFDFTILFRLIQFFNDNALVYCDFLPQQFGIDNNFNVKLLDVEALTSLPDKQSYLYADIHCHNDDHVCHRPGLFLFVSKFKFSKCFIIYTYFKKGCYKSGKFVRNKPRNVVIWQPEQTEKIDEVWI